MCARVAAHNVRLLVSELKEPYVYPFFLFLLREKDKRTAYSSQVWELISLHSIRNEGMSRREPAPYRHILSTTN